MKKQNPKKMMDCLEKVLDAWREFAPEVAFGNITLKDFEAKVNTSLQARQQVTNVENELKGVIVSRDNSDLAAWLLKTLIVNGVIGNPDFGPNSALYEAMGYVRKSERKSGLTRKKKEVVV